jgi:hypothetical protein
MKKETISAAKLIQDIEAHCDEKLQGSGRFKFQLEAAIQREIDRRVHLEQKIRKVIDHDFGVYDPSTSKVIADKSKINN